MLKGRFIWLSIAIITGCSTSAEQCPQLPDDQRVGNAGCLIARPGAVVMVQQRVGATWAIPGGTAEPGERAACTAMRETREETGLNVNVREHLAELENGFHIYRCEADAENALLANDAMEIQSVEWKSRKERAAIAWRFPAQRDVVESLIQRFE